MGHFRNATTMPIVNMAIPAVIQTGDNTHHQDQVIYPVNLNATNRIVNNPAKPTRPDSDFVSLITSSFYNPIDTIPFLSIGTPTRPI